MFFSTTLSTTLSTVAAQADEFAQLTANHIVVAATQAVIAARTAHAFATSDRAMAVYQGIARLFVAFCVAAVVSGRLCRMLVEAVADWLERGSAFAQVAEVAEVIPTPEPEPEPEPVSSLVSIAQPEPQPEPNRQSLSLRALRDLCRAHGLRTGGSKAALLARLSDHADLEAA
jgi:hypothetical protein